MINPSISIVMPVFNTQEYLKEAIESVLAQDYTNFELIVVNDGSWDGSQVIIDYYHNLDRRIKKVWQENRGLSSARNRGMDLAAGKYIYFMDSDDRVEPNLLSQALKVLESSNAEFTFFDGASFSDDFDLSQRRDLNQYKRSLTIPALVKPGYQMFKELLDNGEYFSSVCLLVIRRAFLTGNAIRFKEGALHEDEWFTSVLFLEARRVIYMADRLFWRRYRMNSIMTRSFSMENMNAYLQTAEDLLAFYKRDETKKRQLVKRYVTLMLNAALRKGYQLDMFARIKLLKRTVMRFPMLISAKTAMILLLKSKVEKDG
ncbi:glycosyltransferase family 2 protein [Sphingobacterium hotanense]|uniref:Glycosyltransferase family 2 protein n=1 Tax=Sphingobacterium hotanense TaxID=649196 RepID=A0ABT7NHJ1_9SPHI|nr:glycosyltransferase family 2 protein [Sphingobacterium hotanense]MDM1046661.1 glycosyltransferase family 2 protein [Sphingobacterium hotanense]